MGAVVTFINALLTAIFDALVWPFLRLDPLWPLIFVSLVAGIIILWIFGKISNQDAIRTIRNRIRGNLLAIRFFQDDVGVLLRLQGAIAADSLRYFGYSLIPMMVILPPMVVLMIHLNTRFNDRPLAVGETAVIKAHVQDASLLRQDISLEVPAGLALETPPVRIPSEREAAWRLRADKTGDYLIHVRLGDKTVEKTISVDEKWKRTSPYRTASAVVAVFYPGESVLDSSSPIQSISVDYPELAIGVLGFRIHWIVIFLVLSIVFTFALRGVMGVEI